MKNKTKRFLPGCVAAAFITACNEDDNNGTRRIKGPDLDFADGKAWTSVQLNADGAPSTAANASTPLARRPEEVRTFSLNKKKKIYGES